MQMHRNMFFMPLAWRLDRYQGWSETKGRFAPMGNNTHARNQDPLGRPSTSPFPRGLPFLAPFLGRFRALAPSLALLAFGFAGRKFAEGSPAAGRPARSSAPLAFGISATRLT